MVLEWNQLETTAPDSFKDASFNRMPSGYRHQREFGDIGRELSENLVPTSYS